MDLRKAAKEGPRREANDEKRNGETSLKKYKFCKLGKIGSEVYNKSDMKQVVEAFKARAN